MPQAQIVGDRFPVMKQVNNELDEARKEVKREASKIKNKKNKENILAGIAKSKYALLKNEGDLVEKERKKYGRKKWSKRTRNRDDAQRLRRRVNNRKTSRAKKTRNR